MYKIMWELHLLLLLFTPITLSQLLRFLVDPHNFWLLLKTQNKICFSIFYLLNTQLTKLNTGVLLFALVV